MLKLRLWKKLILVRLCSRALHFSHNMTAMQYVLKYAISSQTSQRKRLILRSLMYGGLSFPLHTHTHTHSHTYTCTQTRLYWKDGDDNSDSFHLFIRPDVFPAVPLLSPPLHIIIISLSCYILFSPYSFVAPFLLLNFISASWHRSFFFLHMISRFCCPSGCFSLNYLVCPPFLFIVWLCLL